MGHMVTMEMRSLRVLMKKPCRRGPADEQFKSHTWSFTKKSGKMKIHIGLDGERWFSWTIGYDKTKELV